MPDAPDAWRVQLLCVCDWWSYHYSRVALVLVFGHCCTQGCIKEPWSDRPKGRSAASKRHEKVCFQERVSSDAHRSEFVSTVLGVQRNPFCSMVSHRVSNGLDPTATRDCDIKTSFNEAPEREVSLRPLILYPNLESQQGSVGPLCPKINRCNNLIA